MQLWLVSRRQIVKKKMYYKQSTQVRVLRECVEKSNTDGCQGQPSLKHCFVFYSLGKLSPFLGATRPHRVEGCVEQWHNHGFLGRDRRSTVAPFLPRFARTHLFMMRVAIPELRKMILWREPEPGRVALKGLFGAKKLLLKTEPS